MSYIEIINLRKLYEALRKDGYKYVAADKDGRVNAFKEMPYKDRKKKCWRYTKKHKKENPKIYDRLLNNDFYRSGSLFKKEFNWFNKFPCKIEVIRDASILLEKQLKEEEKIALRNLKEGDVVYLYKRVQKGYSMRKVIIDEVVMTWKDELAGFVIFDKTYGEDGYRKDSKWAYIRPCNEITNLEYKERRTICRAKYLVRKKEDSLDFSQAVGICKALSSISDKL